MSRFTGKRKQPLEEAGSAKKTTNSTYNRYLTELREHLARTGKLTRYSFRHLNLWAEGMVAGRYTSVHDEPQWENLLDAVECLPRSDKRLSAAQGLPQSPATPSVAGSADNYMSFLLLNQERRDEEERREERRQEEDRRREERQREEERREERTEREERRWRQEMEERREEQRRRDEQFLLMMKMFMEKK